MPANAGEKRAAVRERVGVLVAAALLAAVATPQFVRHMRDSRAEATGIRLRELGSGFSRYHHERGSWPCHWGHRSGQLELDSLACRVPALPGPRDAWGRAILAVYQRPTPRIPGAANGVIALISAGADGRVSTSRRRAVEGKPVGDDSVHVVTRDAG